MNAGRGSQKPASPLPVVGISMSPFIEMPDDYMVCLVPGEANQDGTA